MRVIGVSSEGMSFSIWSKASSRSVAEREYVMPFVSVFPTMSIEPAFGMSVKE